MAPPSWLNNASKLWNTASHVNPVSNAAYAITGGRIGTDITPNYSATNVVRTQAPKAYNSAMNAYEGSQATGQASHNPAGVYSTGPGDLTGTGIGTDQAGVNALGGGAGGAGGTGGIDMNQRNGLADQLRSIISAYDSLSGGVDTTSNDAINTYNKQYAQQAGDLNTQYQDTTNQLGGQYQSRGLGDSGFYGSAQDQAKNTYNTNSQSLIDQRNTNLSSIGQQAATAKASYGAGHDQYAGILGGLNNYTQADLNNLGQSLPGAMSGVHQAQAGQGTQAQFLQSIQGLPALHNDGQAQLQAQLQKLAVTGAPSNVKQQIAQGMINQAQIQDPAAQSQYQQYFQQLLGA